MFSNKQCEMAREATGRYDLNDEDINNEYDDLNPSVKEEVGKELVELFMKKDSERDRRISEIARTRWISQPILYLLYKEYKFK